MHNILLVLISYDLQTAKQPNGLVLNQFLKSSSVQNQTVRFCMSNIINHSTLSEHSPSLLF